MEWNMKLQKGNLTDTYEQVFKEWVSEGVIEEVSCNESTTAAHYLPHRPVIKDSIYSTTKVRPVFDASAHEKGKPSLNHCLEKGLNLIEKIPVILLRFRENYIDVVSDIRKAFLQISIHPDDRNFLRFLWIGSDGIEKLYRHRRVVFGVNCSPFLLGATIEYHLSRCLEKCEGTKVPYSSNTVVKLSSSFYVDNCATSVCDEAELHRFIQESKDIMEEGKFDLRGWEYTRTTGSEVSVVPVLGLTWIPDRDILKINRDCINKKFDFENVTKRVILSMAQRIFDPIGFTCPSTLIPKLLLQHLWEKKLAWDDPVDVETERAFRDWMADLPCLLEIGIPRWIGGNYKHWQHASLHTFCDASKDAISCVIFLRVSRDDVVSVHLLSAKARVAPLRRLTIPRLELLAATIGARVYADIRKNLEGNIDSYFWSDSTTVLAWIRRREQWGTYVWNRVEEIRMLTTSEAWRHVPGVLNPSDLPSRGCSPKQLLDSKWWEGPNWLYEAPDCWPNEISTYNENEISNEKRKLVTTLLDSISDSWHLTHFGDYSRTLRMMAWVFRFEYNARHCNDKQKGELTVDEINKAEIFILKIIQLESFSNSNDKRLSGLNVYQDEHGLLRLKSQVSRRKDHENFRFPIVLPSKHPVIDNLILDMHKNKSHVGAQGLLSLLRENYWILGGRRTVKTAVSRCVTCKKYNSRPFTVEPPPLPMNRVRDAVAFEVTGVDMAGPLYLKTGEKAWVCLFTCAVYRVVHFELCTSLSTNCFMQAFRRFVARRGRPKTVYSDNGTNFVGTENVLAKLDWKKITKERVQRISWLFNPPTAAWWGGFWERMVGVMKQLLRKVLGRSCLNYEDLLTILCDCESIINARPLTYISSDPRDLVPLTPSMFLRDLVENGLPDYDEVDRMSLNKKLRYKQQLRHDLRLRFRNEYLGQLKLLRARRKSRSVVLGKVVLVGDDNMKRLDWPLGRVVEILPGKDEKIRLVRVHTARGQMLRPVQRLYPLECLDLPEIKPKETQPVFAEDQYDSEEATSVTSESQIPDDYSDGESAGVFSKSRVPGKITRSGRVSRIPNRFL